MAGELAAAIPALAHLVELRYGGITRIGYINKTRRLVYIIESNRGVLQGDPLASAAFTKAYTRVLDRVRNQYKNVTILGIMDDTYFIGAFDDVLAAWRLATLLAETELGLSFRPDKSVAVVRDAKELSLTQMADLEDENIPLRDGMLIAGIPLGSAAFVAAELDKVVTGIQSKADAMVQTATSTPSASQAVHTSACLGLASMFTHLLRSLPPSDVEMHARLVDDISVGCLRKLLALEHVDADSAAGHDMRDRMFLSAKQGLGLMSCARMVDAAYIGHWALVGPTVQKMLPLIALSDNATMALRPLAELTAAAARIKAVAASSGIKRLVSDVPLMLSNSVHGLQGDIGSHLNELAYERVKKGMPIATAEQQARRRALISGASKEAGAGVHASRRFRLNRLTHNEHRVTCALRLGVDAFPAPMVPVRCPDCHQIISDLTAHALACGSKQAQGRRTEIHTSMDTASRELLRSLGPELVVSGSYNAYPFDCGFQTTVAHPEAVNHHADAHVFDTSSGTSYLIDFTFTNAAVKTGKNGAAPGSQADAKEAEKEKQYADEFVGFTANSSPALLILAMEHHGSWSKGTCDYWEAIAHRASVREKATSAYPTHKSVIIRRVRQTLAVALRRLIAARILQFHRRAIYGAQRVGRRSGRGGVLSPSGGL